MNPLERVKELTKIIDEIIMKVAIALIKILFFISTPI